MITPPTPYAFRATPFRRRLLLALPLAGFVAACTATTPPGTTPGGETVVRLGGTSFGVVFGDPARRATDEIANSIAVPSRLRGRPDELARGLGFYEYAAVALAEPRWIDLNPMVVPRLAEGRAELRGALGIRQDAPTQVVMDSFFRTAAALSVNDRVGAERSFPPEALAVSPTEFLSRLEAVPRLPAAERGAAVAGAAMQARDNRGGVRWSN
jgi:hypothetical protein